MLCYICNLSCRPVNQIMIHKPNIAPAGFEQWAFPIPFSRAYLTMIPFLIKTQSSKQVLLCNRLLILLFRPSINVLDILRLSNLMPE